MPPVSSNCTLSYKETEDRLVHEGQMKCLKFQNVDRHFLPQHAHASLDQGTLSVEAKHLTEMYSGQMPNIPGIGMGPMPTFEDLGPQPSSVHLVPATDVIALEEASHPGIP